jgi:hypothetical protein
MAHAPQTCDCRLVVEQLAAGCFGAGSSPAVDPDRLRTYAVTVFSTMAGAFTAGMIHLGDHLARPGAGLEWDVAAVERYRMS